LTRKHRVETGKTPALREPRPFGRFWNGNESRKIDFESLKIDPESRKIGFEGLKIDPEGLKIDFESRKIGFEGLKIDLESPKIDPECLKIDLKSLKIGFESLIDGKIWVFGDNGVKKDGPEGLFLSEFPGRGGGGV
jgi:hypothetical protein